MIDHTTHPRSESVHALTLVLRSEFMHALTLVLRSEFMHALALALLWPAYPLAVLGNPLRHQGMVVKILR